MVNADGKMERSFMLVMDANIRGPDALFALLRNYLGQLGITEAERVLFVADGARWIWNRISALVHGLGLKSEQVYKIDFYHAVEHLGKVAGENWSVVSDSNASDSLAGAQGRDSRRDEMRDT